MKNIFVILLVFFAVSSSVMAQRDSMIIKTGARLGVFSPDSENEGAEKDVLLSSSKLPKIQDIVSVGPGANKMFLKDHPQSEAMAMQAANFLKGKELQVSLIPQQKYMISECLGVKASVGEYKIQLAMPFVKVDQNGLFIKFEIDKIVDNKVTIRTRPCYKDGQCHFSPQLAIGGTMTDVRLEITLNPIMDLQNCDIISIGMPHFKWRIGGLNYKPLQNNLDEMVKNMMEDAMTVATELIMPGRIEEAFNFIDMSGANCGLPKVENTNNNASSSNPATTSEQQWVITANPVLKGITGRILVNGPTGAKATIQFFRQGEPRHFETWYNPKADNFIPANYDITINGAKIFNAPVEKLKETRIKTGVLNVLVESTWKLLDPNGKAFYTAYTAQKIILPVGRYKVSLQGKEMEVVIKDGEVTDF